MQSYKTLQIKATKIASYISIINSLRVVHVGLSKFGGAGEFKRGCAFRCLFGKQKIINQIDTALSQ